MTDREGPSLTLNASCFGCNFEVSESYRVQSDSGSDVFCAHPSHESRRRVGDTIWTTPDWCPLADIPAIRERLATPAQPVDETERLREALEDTMSTLSAVKAEAIVDGGGTCLWIAEKLNQQMIDNRATLNADRPQDKGEVSRG